MLDNSAKANEARKALYLSYQQAKGFYGVYQKRSSIEGDDIYLYLATEDGKLILVTDYTHDRFGIRDFLIEHPVEIFMGSRDTQGNFVEVASGENQNKGLVLKCVTQSGKTLYI
jgi:hypothetical protein